MGENRVQEALAKQDQTAGLPVAWHLIGTLQRNKVRHAIGRFALIHSVDRLDLAAELQPRMPAGERQPVLVQVNCSGEAQKGGVSSGGPAGPPGCHARRSTGLEVRGLMTMAALADEDGQPAAAFRLLRRLRDDAVERGHRLSGVVDGHVGRLSGGGGRRGHDGAVGNPAVRGANMTDDAFHLTPHDVRAQEFPSGLRGYDRAQVDDFKLRVAEEIERLLRERLQWEERLRNMQEQLRAFRDRERAMNDALIAAQQLRTETKQQADREAEAIIREARSEAMQLLAQASQEESAIRERSDAAARQFAAYVANFRALLERQLAEVEGLQAHATAMHQVQTELSLKRQA